MRPIRWLHISDFHLHEKQSSKQDAVLDAMLHDIKQRGDGDVIFDFVLVTGDLAFSGKESEYELVESFFTKLSSTIGLSCNRIFCVPGNHDVDRSRQKMSFAGARRELRSQTDIYSFLANVEERETLLTRQANFRKFQERFFSDQPRNRTQDDLGYVSVIDVNEIRIAIIGLNSAWLAEGGQSDDRQLLIGEEQVRNAVKIVNTVNPHVIIGMVHHPFDYLCDFDRWPTRRSLEEICHYFHCGHLHFPDASSIESYSGRCLTLAAGALFESREAYNGYTTVTLDVLRAKADVTFIHFDPNKGVFFNESKKSYPHEVDAAVSCAISDLGSAIERYCPVGVANFTHYLAALLLGNMSEVPMLVDNVVAFRTTNLLQEQSEDEFAAVTKDFLGVGNVIKLLHNRESLDEILNAHGHPITMYGAKLEEVCETYHELRAELEARETNARKLAGTGPRVPFQHTLALLDELRSSDDWNALREQAERSCDLKNPVVAAEAKRMLALCLARSTEQGERQRAARIYQELIDSAEGRADDWASLATLQIDDEDSAQAQETIRNAIMTLPAYVDRFIEIGRKILEATGDVEFREWLSAQKKDGRKI